MKYTDKGVEIDISKVLLALWKEDRPHIGINWTRRCRHQVLYGCNNGQYYLDYWFSEEEKANIYFPCGACRMTKAEAIGWLQRNKYPIPDNLEAEQHDVKVPTMSIARQEAQDLDDFLRALLKHEKGHNLSSLQRLWLSRISASGLMDRIYNVAYPFSSTY